MRPMGGLLLALVTASCAASAFAQTTTPVQSLDPAQRALLNDIFAPKPKKAREHRLALTTTTLGLRENPRSAEAAGGVFALPAVTGTGLDQVRLLAPEKLIDGEGLVVWRTNEVTLPGTAQGAVDTVRMSIGGVARAPGGVVVARPDALFDPDAETFDVTYTRGWPSAWKVSAGRYDLDVTPHAGFGVNNAGGTAEAGAMLRFGADMGDRVMSRLGVQASDPSTFAGRGRWFLFAAASGRAVGLNMLPTAQGGLQRGGWSAEPSNALVSDAQAGLGWSRGMVQASFGYVHRDVKSQAPLAIGPEPSSYRDSMVAFSLSIHAH
jgi:Uncharacterized protein conserved in bacteria (DUF2219)